LAVSRAAGKSKEMQLLGSGSEMWHYGSTRTAGRGNCNVVNKVGRCSDIILLLATASPGLSTVIHVLI
jgi:hypothetical protein